MNIYTENEITSWIVCFLCFFLFLVLSKSDMQRKGTAERFSQKAPQSKADIWALNHSMISPPCVSHPASLLHVLDPHPPEDQVDHAFLLLMGRRLQTSGGGSQTMLHARDLRLCFSAAFDFSSHNMHWGWTGRERAALGVSCVKSP